MRSLDQEEFEPKQPRKRAAKEMAKEKSKLWDDGNPGWKMWKNSWRNFFGCPGYFDWDLRQNL